MEGVGHKNTQVRVHGVASTPAVYVPTCMDISITLMCLGM